MANAKTHTMSIMIRAKRLDRRLREYVKGRVTAKYLQE